MVSRARHKPATEDELFDRWWKLAQLASEHLHNGADPRNRVGYRLFVLRRVDVGNCGVRIPAC